MDATLNLMPAEFWFLAIAVTLLAGFVKGVVGFGMPMIMISGLGSFLSPELALAALILPTLFSNALQSVRGGWRPAWEALRNFRVYVIVLLVTITLSAQLVSFLSARAMLMIVGVPLTLIATTQLLGWRPHIRRQSRRLAEAIVAVFAGFTGGVSGVWGPPTIALLTALETPKAEHVRLQGVIYGAGSVVLFLAHINSGVLNAATTPMSVFMLLPALLGRYVGLFLHDRLDQDRFRQVTLAILVVAGLNLIRRGLMG